MWNSVEIWDNGLLSALYSLQVSFGSQDNLFLKRIREWIGFLALYQGPPLFANEKSQGCAACADR